MDNTAMAPEMEQENSVVATAAQALVEESNDSHHPVLFWIAAGFLCLSGIGAVVFFILWKKEKKKSAQREAALAQQAAAQTAPAAQPAPAPTQKPAVEAPAAQPNQA